MRRLACALVVSLLVLSGCQPSATVDLTLEVSVASHVLTVSGSTDLPDGTWLCYELRRPGDVTFFADGGVKVEGGRYSTDIDRQWAPGEVVIWLTFQTQAGGVTWGPAQQPPEVIVKFGELGEKLQGGNVTRSGSVRRVECVATVEID